MVIERALPEKIGLCPLPLKDLAKDLESVETGSGRGRKEQGRWILTVRTALISLSAMPKPCPSGLDTSVNSH